MMSYSEIGGQHQHQHLEVEMEMEMEQLVHLRASR